MPPNLPERTAPMSSQIDGANATPPARRWSSRVARAGGGAALAAGLLVAGAGAATAVEVNPWKKVSTSAVEVNPWSDVSPTAVEVNPW